MNGTMWWVFEYIHQLLNTSLRYLKLIEDRQVGWLTFDRKTHAFKREQQPLCKKIKLLLLFNPVTEWIDRTHLLRLWTHKRNVKAGTLALPGRCKMLRFACRNNIDLKLTDFAAQREGNLQSHAQIRAFVDFYHIDMSSFSPSDPEDYPTFEDFFVRELAPNARPIFAPNDPRRAVVVADSRVVVYSTVDRTRKLWVKGSDFTICSLIADSEKAGKWANGSVASFRLSPQDYHRYHSPVTGTVKWHKHICGDYLQVDPVALHSSVSILTENARSCLWIESAEFGNVLFVAIGATDVGTVQ